MGRRFGKVVKMTLEHLNQMLDKAFPFQVAALLMLSVIFLNKSPAILTAILLLMLAIVVRKILF